uniref:RNA-dependent RNA polymerase n=1 Tax=Plectus sambesii TaxID=2011161 RepID=A0A914WKM5_9BILA
METTYANVVGGLIQLKIKLHYHGAADAINNVKIFLNKCSSLCTYDEDSISIMSSFASRHEDSIAEVEVMVKANQNYNCAHTFLKDFLNALRHDARKFLSAQPLLQVVHPREAFFQECTPAHMMRCLLAFELGNFINQGTFFVHYEKQISMCDLKSLIKLRRQPLLHGLFVDFEHDHNSFTIQFATKKYKINVGLLDYGVKIVVRYEWIQRIVVDPKCVDSDGTRAMRVYLQLSGVPRVYHYSGKHIFVSNGYRSVEWHDKRMTDGRYENRPSQTALRECPILSLVFPENHADFYEIVGRLKARTQLSVYFGSIIHEDVDHSKYIVESRRYALSCQKLLQRSSFAIKYAIEALMSRGAVVMDQMLKEREKRDAFLGLVCQLSLDKEVVVLEALERLLNSIDEGRNVTPIFAFTSIFKQLQLEEKRLTKMRENDRQEGYIRVRKVVVTPSRLLLLSPERMMGNRVLNKFDPNGEFALRIQFRDDDGSVLRASRDSDFFLNNTVNRVMKDGLTIAGRRFAYLGSSNSQLHDHGCYFFSEYPSVTIHTIRQWMGEFDMENIAKRMARMGQCLTQARKLIEVDKLQYAIMDDVQLYGDGNKLYTFSDGVGRISVAFATQIAQGYRLKNHVPSCFQIRFRGFKGVLSVDPTLDRRIQRNNGQGRHIIFRKSQHKFKTPAAHGNGLAESLEIVKFSAPTTVCLNRPMIAILDQVSEKQSGAAHKRVKERIHYLLESDLNELISMFINEAKCAKTLANDLPHRFDIHRLKACGFALTTEPFMRLLTRAIARYRLKRQLVKDQIRIPTDLGRTLFGIMDETGQLNYGEIFVQITEDINATPGFHTKKRIISGKVMVTKNPCTVSGDIRLLNAVDIPQLRHLNDVIVFPSRGPRPHPDEMAGSDLDGDEYAVIWDPELMFDKNEPVGIRDSLMGKMKKIDEQNLDAAMTEFFLEFIKSDTIGSIANAHLVNADCYGIESEVCTTIAEKAFQAVDFAKTGAMPADLTTKPENGLPPERPVYYPDFMGYGFKPTYYSPRLLGEIFRRIKAVDNVYSLTENAMQAEVVVDPDLTIDGWNRPCFLLDARLQRNNYAALIRALMEEYGIADEGQLMSGAITNLRKRISDREHDNHSAYTTERIIGQRVSEIVDQFRIEFFTEFGGVEQCTEPVDEWNEHRRVCVCPSAKMQLKASTWYMVSYGECPTGVLGFPWIVWDVLAFIKQWKNHPNKLCDPIAENLSARINSLASDDRERKTESLLNLHSNKRLAWFLQTYPGLRKLFLALLQWMRTEEAFDEKFHWDDICQLFVEFGVGNHNWSFPSEHGNFLSASDSQPQLAVGKVGRYLIDFLQYLASRDYSIIATVELLPLHRMAIKAFYHLAVTGTFYALGLSQTSTADYHHLTIVEEKPFMIELPEHAVYTNEHLCQHILQKTGVHQVFLRRMGRTNRVMISARGNFESLHRLRELVIVKHAHMHALIERIVAQQ